MSRFDGVSDEFSSRFHQKVVKDFPQQASCSVERQLLLSSFAAAALTGYLSQGPTDCNRHEIAHDCFQVADAMLLEFEKRVKL